MSGNNHKRKFTGTEILTDSDDDSYVIPPAAFKKAKTEGSQIITRNTASRRNETKAVSTTNITPTNDTNDSLENVTYEAVKYTQKNQNATKNETFTGKPNSPRCSNHTNTSYVAFKPNFAAIPKKKSLKLKFTNMKDKNTKEIEIKREALNRSFGKKTRLDKKYAHDPLYCPKAQKIAKQVTLYNMENNIDEEEKNKDDEKTTSVPSTIRTLQHARFSERNISANLATNNFTKPEFDIGSIVKINGRDLDPEKYEIKDDPPVFLGCVQSPLHFDQERNLDCDATETLVEFIVAGEYVWQNKNTQNTVQKVVHNNSLTQVVLPPNELHNTRIESLKEINKWFKVGPMGWEIKKFEDPCVTCGSPYCFFKNNKNTLNAIVIRVKHLEHLTNKERRHQAYFDGVKSVYPAGTRGVRRRLGYCFVEMVRGVFPDEEYKGFRYSDYHTDEGV